MCDIQGTGRGNDLAQTDATYYHGQLGLPGKVVLVVCYVEWLESMIYGMGLWTSTRFVAWSLVVVRLAIELKHRNANRNTYHTYI